MTQSITQDDRNGLLIDLLPQEITHSMYEGSMSRTNIFEGELPLGALKKRIQEIIISNPWLASRLCTNKSTGHISLWIPNSPDISPLFEHHNIADVCSAGNDTTSVLLESFTPNLKPVFLNLFAKQGFKCLDKDEPLFKIRALNGDNGRFMLLISMSHVLGDGATFYQVHSMLNSTSPVFEMDPIRTHFFEKIHKETNCIPGGTWLPPSMATDNNERLDWLIKSKALCSSKASRQRIGMHGEYEGDDSKSLEFSGGFFHVNPSWIEEQKSTFSNVDKQFSWISTNDAITSWFMKKSDASVGLMAMNARERVDELYSELAGNYLVGLVLYRDEFDSPLALRKAVNQPSGITVPIEPNSKAAFVTNSSQFYQDMNLGPTCQFLMHIPMGPQELIGPAIIDSFMFVFFVREGELCVALQVRSLDGFLDGTALGEPLNPFL